MFVGELDHGCILTRVSESGGTTDLDYDCPMRITLDGGTYEIVVGEDRWGGVTCNGSLPDGAGPYNIAEPACHLSPSIEGCKQHIEWGALALVPQENGLRVSLGVTLGEDRPYSGCAASHTNQRAFRFNGVLPRGQ